MKTVEIRRHSKRGEGKGLSKEGKKIAQKAAGTLSPPYALLISSPKKRARETMEAFGFKDYREDERFVTIQSPVIEKLEEKLEKVAEEKGITLLEAFFLVGQAKKALRKWGKTYLDAVIDISKELADNERALIVSHGGSIEPAALLSFDKFNLKEIGGPLDYCEGVEFIIENNKVSRVNIIRL